MAIKRTQKLVNLHTSAMTDERLVDLKSALEFGEIAIKYAPDSPTIYTKVKDSGETVSLAEFIDKAAVKALINAEGVEALKTRVSTLEGLHASTATTVAQEVATGLAALDAKFTKTGAENGGLAYNIEQVDGKITAFTASIAENTFDAYGSASSALASAKTYTDEQVLIEKNRAIGVEDGLLGLHADKGQGKATVAEEVNAGIEGITGVSKSGSSHSVEVKVDTAKGSVTAVTVTAPDFAALYDEKGAAASALTAAKAYTDEETVRAQGAEEKLFTLHATGETAGSYKTVKQEVEAGINALNATVSQSAGTDGLALQVVETNGKLVSVSGSIAANTYDAYGAASSAKTEIVGTASTEYDNLGKVQAKIVAEASARETADETLQSNIDAIYKAGSSATEESGVLVDKINALDATVTGENSTKQIKVEVVEENGKLTSVSVTAGALEVSGAAATAKSELLGDASEDYNTLGKLEDKIQAEATRADGVEKEISGNVTTIQNQLDGFTSDKGSVKTYVDNKVVGLLHFKGTVHVDEQTKLPVLPDITTTAVTHGDVYNVVEEFIYDGYKYPAGTNVVAIKLSGETVLDEPYWDALGGTVDLEPYAKKQESTADTKDTMSVAGAKLYAKDLNDSMDTRVDALEADMPGVKAAVGTLTGDTGVTGSVKQQIKAAKDIIDAYTVNGYAISNSPVLNGADIKLNGYSIASAAAAIGTGDTVNVALGKLEYKVNANTSAITSEVTRATGVENTLLALHADATSGKKSVATEVSEGISGISAVTKDASSCGASVSVTTQSGSVSAVTFDLTAIEINCGEF